MSNTSGASFAILLASLGSLYGATAFPLGGTFAANHYIVMNHGTAVSFTPAAYRFSYLHGILFAVVSLVWIAWLWYLRHKTHSVSDATI